MLLEVEIGVISMVVVSSPPFRSFRPHFKSLIFGRYVQFWCNNGCLQMFWVIGHDLREFYLPLYFAVKYKTIYGREFSFLVHEAEEDVIDTTLLVLFVLL